MSEFTLHCFKESGNAYKAGLMLELCGADWDAVWVDFFNGETRADPYRSDVNEMGEVPVLAHGDRRLSQTGAILHYLSDHFAAFGPGSEEDRYEILRWMFFDNHKLTSYTGTYRFLHRWAPGVDPAVKSFFRDRMIGAWKVLEARLQERRFVVGDAPTIADLSLCGYLYFREEVDEMPSDWPATTAWLERIQALPGWAHPYDLLPGGPEK